MRTLTLTALSLLGACGWSHLPDNDYQWIPEPLWDASTPIASADGVYISLPRSGGIALVQPNGQFSQIDIGAGAISKLSLAPDQSTLMGFIERVSCKEDDERKLKKMKYVHDCPNEKRDVSVSLAAIKAGTVQSETAIPKLFNTLEYSNDGQWAIAYVDYTQNVNTNNAGWWTSPLWSSSNSTLERRHRCPWVSPPTAYCLQMMALVLLFCPKTPWL